MASEHHDTVLRGIERIFNQGSLTGMAEGQLLRQFASRGDEAAFEALVRRHGPMVLGVCRRMLYNPHDVEDAFQATFLVLLRRAGALRDADPLGPWLHGVAYRVAARIRANSARRPAEERKGARTEAVESPCDLERLELRHGLDEEISRLPERFRRPVVLCYLEGRTHEEAARRLRCTEGSVRGRLDRARQKLRDRLTRRGLAPTAGLVTVALTVEPASAAVPPSLLAGTVTTLMRAATARAVATTVSVAVRELADGVFRTMILSKLKLAASALAAVVALLAVGMVLPAALTHSLAHDETAGTTAGASPSNGAPRPLVTPDSDRATNSIDFRVVDKRTGKPLPGVALVVQAELKEVGRPTTDAAGRIAIMVSVPAPKFVQLRARKEGYAPMLVVMGDPSIEGEIPASHTMRMVPVEPVGGVVRDEQGRPIAGVKVTPHIWTRTPASSRSLREEFDVRDTVTTDAQGRWRCETMPEGIEPERVWVEFTHPDYQRVELPSGKALEAIGRGEATVLPRGLELAGRVFDHEGRPILGARVFRGSNRSESGVTTAETDADGRFQFAHLPAGETVLTVQAKGHAADLRKVAVRPDLTSVEFHLEQGRMIRGRVVDSLGKPLGGVTIGVDGWRGNRTLDWRTTTDAEGRFQWDNAPAEPVWINITREGYLYVSDHEVGLTGDELMITLVKQLKVRGTVVDAETRHAIKSFTLVPGTESGGDFATYWERGAARPVRGGRYEIHFEHSSPEGRRLRIEAEGFMPEVSRLIRDDEDEPVINFVLHKAGGVSGAVHLPNGSPLAGADVVLVVPSQPAFIINGQPPTGDDHRVVKSGADGRFAFPAQEPPFTVLVLHDRGFAGQASDSKPSAVYDLAIKPWGRIEGIQRIGSRPGADQTLSLAYERQGDTPKALPYWSGTTTTDDSGRFAFDRVMPGEATVSWQIQIRTSPSSTTTSQSHSVPVDVEPGKTSRTVIGGTGRPIVGRMTVPAEIAGRVDWAYSLNWLTRKQPKVVPPPGLDLEAKQKWHAAWSHSAEGKAYRRAQRWYAVKVAPDGLFRVEDVEAGTYDLRISVNERPLNPRSAGFGGDPLGWARRAVIVPEMPCGRSDEPLDLGAIALEPAKKPVVIKVGDPAPPFRVEDLGGQILSLADYQGRYLLLDFWATWCGPCLAETPHLKATFEAFGKDKHFAMIGLSLDASKDDPRQYATKHGLGWTQGFLGDWSQAKLPETYGVQGIPSIWLIGPDGRVVAKDLRGAQIQAAVAKALGRP
jgi:RNA polymerase sigma factor (sigma-70 family)